MFCDGNSHTGNAIYELKVCGYVELLKEDCTSHVPVSIGMPGTQLVADTEHYVKAEPWQPGEANG